MKLYDAPTKCWVVPISDIKTPIAGQVKPEVKPAKNVDMDNCFYCGHRASELTQIRIAIKPPNAPNRWKVIGVACNTCNDKFISQIDPSRLSV